MTSLFEAILKAQALLAEQNVKLSRIVLKESHVAQLLRELAPLQSSSAALPSALAGIQFEVVDD